MNSWIDTHCHLDAAEFSADAPAVRARARQAGVGRLVIPGVAVSNFQTVRELAHQNGDAYALGIHPLCVAQSVDADLATRRAGCNLKHPTRSSHLAHKTLRESQHLEAVHANRSHHTQTQMALSRIGSIKRVLSCIATRFEPGPLTRPLQAHCHMR